jgi:uncharacterized protein (UPF0261 family)
MKTVAILGTLDTKGAEFAFLKDRIAAQGLGTLMIDCSTAGKSDVVPDVTADEIARLGGSSLAALHQHGERGEAIRVMGLGARDKLLALYQEGKIHGAISGGGSGNTSIAAAAMRSLPFGFPKLILSTMASGDVSSYVDISDMTLMHSVGDIEGLNRLTLQVLSNAAGAIAGMVQMETQTYSTKLTVGITMFGVTTPAAKAIRAQLEAKGFEVLVFHATGKGGRAMEALIEQGVIQGVIDLTTTEIADEVVGGILNAGPDRLKAAVKKGIPCIIVPGALDMVNFGPKETVPEKFSARNLHVHNPHITLMRTTAEENRIFAKFMAGNLRQADPDLVTILLPLQGVSAIDKKGAVFYDPTANQAFCNTLKDKLGSVLPIVELDAHINDQRFADAVVTHFLHNWALQAEESIKTAAK